MTTPRKKLSDLFPGAGGLADTWTKTETAAERVPLPKGEYEATIIRGELSESSRFTPGYKLTFEVSEGEFAGRLFWHDCWLTPKALPYTKRDLAKLGITSAEQMERPLPARFRCRVKLVLRKEDDGTEYNRVDRFEVLGVEKPDPFAPSGAGEAAA